MVTSIQNFSIVLIDESNDTINDTTALLTWIKKEVKEVTTVAFKSGSVPTLQDLSKCVDFAWKKIPNKEDFAYAFLRSSNHLKDQFITDTHVKEIVQKSNPKLTILILVRNVSKSKMINKQVQSALSTFGSPFEIKVASNGHEAIDLIYNSSFAINMIMIDNALGTSLGDVTFLEVVRHLQYAESTKDGLLVGLTTNSNLNSDYLIKSGCDTVLPLPLPATPILKLKFKKFFGYKVIS